MSEDRASAPDPPHRPAGTSATDEVEADRRTRGTARRALSSPQGARRAIVLRELLGPPVALRRGPSDVPGLSP